MKAKKVPQRLCLGCQQSKPKKELLRIVRSKEGEYAVDTTGRMPGRGAYICHSLDCFALAKKNHGLERSFGCRIAPEVYAALEAQLQQELGTVEDKK